MAGSIPAHTGKPAERVERLRVYPRPHGEALRGGCLCRTDMGLSPPTRGSRLGQGRRPRRAGSIPAHTGKPMTARSARIPKTVYPRPHGEARARLLERQRIRGLSPPTRGSRRSTVGATAIRGSIPAHTGKPASRERQCAQARVYPRPHGEARIPPIPGGFSRGLSPPTRGSLAPVVDRMLPQRSIPAHTGKPPRGSP